MSRQAIEELLDQWQNNPAFREVVRADPEGAVRAASADLDEAEWAALKNMDWSASDEELALRVRESKGWGNV